MTSRRHRSDNWDALLTYLGVKSHRGGVCMMCRLSVRALLLAILLVASINASAQTYVQTNLVSDIPGQAQVTTDHLLVNPWGIARSATSPWWVADNETGVSTIYNGAGI